ncbi:hypothetical protein P3X46_000183 [Hevea brasiliensis]|uniref:Protein kinase domain-containing protein n=2 Tax=Hevea brasiliensis TaxID=3981 RepID=A0ABQ9N8S3_HEVBR|nr:hypothetical protein P3X46_000183 [Hevea brasiliensis]
MAVDASDPNSARSTRTRPSQASRTRSSQSPRTPSTPRLPTFASSTASSTSFSAASAPSTSNTSGGFYTTTSSSTLSSRTSLSSLRQSISQSPNIYDISEIRAATNNFLAKRYSTSSTACWRCTLRDSETIVFQRKFRRKMEMSQLREHLGVICRGHHRSVIKLLGVSLSGEHIYLVYEFIAGANLADCLRNARNPNFTVLSSWISRMQVAADLAQGLDYIHNQTGLNLTLVHNHIKSSGIIVTEPHFNAKICHFGTAQLCGEPQESKNLRKKSSISKEKSEITEVSEEDEDKSKQLKRSNSGVMQFEGVRGYMSPEFQASGIATQESDVYAFGVLILELLSGEEPLKYKYDKSTGDFIRTSLIDTARAAIDGGGDDAGGDGGREGRLRRWMDRRLNDSFPVDIAEKLTRLALQCVHVDPDKRPDMGHVAGKISKWYLASKTWSDNLRMVSGQFSVSLAPR